MKTAYHDVLVLKEYETEQNGRTIKHKAWNRVGRAWKSRSDRSLNFELYLLPGQKYVISLQEPKTQSSAPDSFENFETISL